MHETSWAIERQACSFRLLSASWPRPTQWEGRRWTAEPEWDAPLTPLLPRWSRRVIGAAPYHVLDWRETFSDGADLLGNPRLGELRGFHVVFRLRVERGGVFTIVDTGGLVLRRNGAVAYERREARGIEEHAIKVTVGDQLEVAHAQVEGEWIWGIRRIPVRRHEDSGVALFASYCPAVEQALRAPNGPPLKVYTAAVHPLRTVLCIYSLVLNGYRPAGIQVFGDYQWDAPTRQLMAALLPFADQVSVARVDRILDAVDPRLKPLAHQAWYAMKLCVCLFVPPYDYCCLDDDVFVLDSLGDALTLSEEHDLVYAPDADYDEVYRSTWCPDRQEPLPTANINMGIYFLRSTPQPARIERLLKTPPLGLRPLAWEQGFFAWEFADARTAALPSQRYYYPVFDGLPGGVMGYDWKNNPCGFVSVHLGGPTIKPDDRECCVLLHEILGRGRNRIMTRGSSGRQEELAAATAVHGDDHASRLRRASRLMG